eukprot:TRINITY_DN11769_c0_g1_i1.p2 TRINITY_DN11769_c0_g1~~TRINITY_DN11769_c0_g1_i1.p2  ORF type:complete len:208 (+),score=56.36 TRINITY_DN11769_c0_g1_i1:376-999(+)
MSSSEHRLRLLPTKRADGRESFAVPCNGDAKICVTRLERAARRKVPQYSDSAIGATLITFSHFGDSWWLSGWVARVLAFNALCLRHKDVQAVSVDPRHDTTITSGDQGFKYRLWYFRMYLPIQRRIAFISGLLAFGLYQWYFAHPAAFLMGFAASWDTPYTRAMRYILDAQADEKYHVCGIPSFTDWVEAGCPQMKVRKQVGVPLPA